ncbi:MAG: carbohydrate kinase [Herpetosiphon sp.]
MMTDAKRDGEATQIDILAIGEALVDLISIERGASLDDVDTFKRYLGGAPVNVAATTARLGRRGGVLARIGQDNFGRFIQSEMRRLEIDDRYLQVDAEQTTTLAFVASTLASPDFLIVRGADANLAAPGEDDEAAVFAYIDDMLSTARAIHISMFTLSKEPCRSFVMQVIKRAHQHQIVISLDPNYRPRIWADPTLLDDTLRQLCPLATLLKPSIDDAIAIFGPGKTPSNYIDMFHQIGAANIALTRGKDGVIVSEGGHQTILLPETVAVADATGAGDAFIAGLILGTIDGLSLPSAARAGQQVAAAKLRAIGHGAPLPAWTTIKSSVI